MECTVEPPDTDPVLFASWRAGNRAAGEALIERHYDSIARFFQNKAGEHADDLAQRTFLVCADPAYAFRGQGTFRSYLFGIARNVLYEHIRLRVRDGRPDPDFTCRSIADLQPGVATIASEKAERRRLVHALQRLPLESQVLLELFYWEELSVEELASVVGIPPGTVKSRLFTARTRLRELLEPDDAQAFGLQALRRADGPPPAPAPQARALGQRRRA